MPPHADDVLGLSLRLVALSVAARVLWSVPAGYVLAALALCVGARGAGLLDADAACLVAAARLRLARRPPLENRTAWVVGASQGIGEAVALELAAKGAAVVLSARREAALEEVRKRLVAAGGVAHVVPLDLSAGPDAVRSAARAAERAAGGGVDVAVLCAAGTQRGSALATADDVDEALLTLNTVAPIRCAKAVLPGMLERGRGRLVVVSSAAGHLASPGQATYCASKHALHGYFASLHAECRGTGVEVTLVCPGPTASGKEGQPRITFGRSLGESMLGSGGDRDASNAAETGKESRMSLERVAELIVAAAWAGLFEVTLASGKVGALLKLNEFCKPLADAVINVTGPSRARAADTGGSLYSVAGAPAGGR